MNNNLEWSKHIPHMTMKPRNVPLFRVSPIIPLTHLWYFKQKVVLSHWTIKGSTYPKWKKIKWVLFFFFFFRWMLFSWTMPQSRQSFCGSPCGHESLLSSYAAAMRHLSEMSLIIRQQYAAIIMTASWLTELWSPPCLLFGNKI